MVHDILVTGASGGIGRCLVEEIRKNHSGKILALGQSRESLARLGEGVVTLAMDLGDPAKFDSLREALRQFNVGYFFQLHGSGNPADSISSFSGGRADELLEVNLFSVIRVLEILLPEMARAHFGRIVLTSTASASHGGGKDSFSYGLSKAGIDYLVRHVAKHYASSGILANAVAPGFITTGFHENRMKKSAEEVHSRGRSVRVGHPGTPEDVARMMACLAWGNNFVTGQIITMDGGDFL